MANQFRETLRTFRAVNKGHGFRARVVSGTQPPATQARSRSATDCGPGVVVSTTVAPAHGANSITARPARAAAPAPQETEVVCELYLYDAIGADFFGDGITAKGVAASLKQAEAAGATELEIYINSPGGDVFEATAIYNVLDRFAGQKHVYVDGLAASAASYIAMVGDTITTAPNAMWMVHDPWGFAIGNAADMREAADLLDKVAGTLVGTYAKRTGLSDEAVRSIMADETWMTAEEALAKGFTDSVSAASDPEPDPDDPNEGDEPGEEEMMPKRAARVAAVMSKFKKVPEGLRPDARSLIASMEARASPRPNPRTGAAKK